MFKAAVQLPASPQMGPEVFLGHLRLSSDSRLTDQSGLLLQLGFWEVKCRLGSLASSKQVWRVTNSIFLPPQHEGLPAQGSPSLKGAAKFCFSFCFPIPSRVFVDIKSCSRMTGDMVPVADELIAGVRLRRKMVKSG